MVTNKKFESNEAVVNEILRITKIKSRVSFSYKYEDVLFFAEVIIKGEKDFAKMVNIIDEDNKCVGKNNYILKGLSYRRYFGGESSLNYNNLPDGFDTAFRTNFITMESGILSSYDDDRMIFLVNEKFLSLFDILGYTTEEIFDLARIFDTLSNFKMAYSHFVNKRDYENAAKAMHLFFDKFEGTIILNSERQQDFIPYLLFTDYFDKKVPLPFKDNLLENYLRSVYEYKKPVFYVPEFDDSSHIKIMRKYSKLFQKTRYKFVKEKTYEDVDYFDLVEADDEFKNMVFCLKSYSNSQIFIGLLKTDSNRLLKLLVPFLNQEYGSGKKKRKFIYVYNKINEILNMHKLKLDVFLLNEKLRSYVLLDILS